MLDRQDRARCSPHDPFGDTAHQQMRHRAAAVGAHDNDIRVHLSREVDDRQRRRVRGQQYGPASQVGPIPVGQKRVELLPSALFRVRWRSE